MNPFKRLGRSLSRHSPEILLFSGLGGMLTSIIFAVRATPKALQLIEEKEAETVPEVIKAAAPVYIPAAISFAASATAIIFGNRIKAGRYAGLTIAYEALRESIAAYRDKVTEVIGEKKEKNIRDEISKERLDVIPAESFAIPVYNSEDYPMVDSGTGAVFPATVAKIDKGVNYANREKNSKFCISYAELLYEWGVPKSLWRHRADFVEHAGWNSDDEDIEAVRTYSSLPDGRPTCIITLYPEPHIGYDKIG